MAKKTISRLSVLAVLIVFLGSMFQNIGIYKCDTG